ncbi:thiol-disulfide oxidoreductase ResA [Bacillus cytotoxicus]|uniref:Thiol-disulfide oxidoreductase ResA n=2 Tax=Bacillus cytotoxicus TaxID=580165 RepID=A0AAX2CEP3_9BACI|nr:MULTISPECIES: thiol-disulfide oxidoreductase ResA [Bacillus cereus group]ABS21519.1 alkyl hydroperoxide reductase/ Thiol specific antioxidant/ Mal allergen [Bacillus cytotoxicus NVH 391-98]AWC28162.1 thiol-disulfide oxidoreductase [Bacillus cytotoxicus]AWC32190.1 thiol-disulfide oxidoreductase [Bacillus cytotoxicus]AWC36219.1 thiol-disulfide oxidoreductase [Bacillus cytotoxicus]AWC40454.1 thiol-disulfide oxidoreductase [Bacillus cytotoxicus]
MKKNRLLFRVLILLILSVAVGFTLYQNFFADKEKMQVGKVAPNFVVTTLDGKKIERKDLKGKGIFLNFWGTWCKPCEKEMPYMNELYPKYKEKGVEIIALDADETEIAVKNFVNQYGLKFPVAIDKGSEVINTYGVGPLPTTFLIDKEGKVIQMITGTQTKEQMEEYLKKITP